MGIVEVLAKAIETYGRKNQMIVAIEELSELQKELCKYLRGADNADRIAEEIGDVHIMLMQLEMMFRCKNEVDNWERYKIDRLERRLEEKDG